MAEGTKAVAAALLLALALLGVLALITREESSGGAVALESSDALLRGAARDSRREARRQEWTASLAQQVPSRTQLRQSLGSAADIKQELSITHVTLRPHHKARKAQPAHVAKVPKARRHAAAHVHKAKQAAARKAQAKSAAAHQLHQHVEAKKKAAIPADALPKTRDIYLQRSNFRSNQLHASPLAQKKVLPAEKQQPSAVHKHAKKAKEMDEWTSLFTNARSHAKAVVKAAEIEAAAKLKAAKIEAAARLKASRQKAAGILAAARLKAHAEDEAAATLVGKEKAAMGHVDNAAKRLLAEEATNKAKVRAAAGQADAARQLSQMQMKVMSGLQAKLEKRVKALAAATMARDAAKVKARRAAKAQARAQLALAEERAKAQAAKARRFARRARAHAAQVRHHAAARPKSALSKAVAPKGNIKLAKAGEALAQLKHTPHAARTPPKADLDKGVACTHAACAHLRGHPASLAPPPHAAFAMLKPSAKPSAKPEALKQPQTWSSLADRYVPATSPDEGMTFVAE